MKLILMLLMMTPILFILLEHPLSFGLILLLKAILVSITTGMMHYNYWFSYILFMVMVGGMLILFIYMTSVASNEKFKFSYKIFMLMLMLLISTMILTLSLDHFFIEMGTLNFELSPNLNSSSYMSMSKYINTPSNFMLYMTITYLLITLIMVVKITNINSGPLRQMF